MYMYHLSGYDHKINATYSQVRHNHFLQGKQAARYDICIVQLLSMSSLAGCRSSSRHPCSNGSSINIISSNDICPPGITSGGVDIALLLEYIQPFLNGIFV